MAKRRRIGAETDWRSPTYTSPVGVTSLTLLSLSLAGWFYLNLRKQ